MNKTACPLGGDCGGTGWVYVPARDVGEPEPAHYEPCECNPYRLGEPQMPMIWLRSFRPIEPRFMDFELVAVGADDAPF